jgi:hypothetical protein
MLRMRMQCMHAHSTPDSLRSKRRNSPYIFQVVAFLLTKALYHYVYYFPNVGKTASELKQTTLLSTRTSDCRGGNNLQTGETAMND